MDPEMAALLAQRARFSPEAFEAYVADYLRGMAHLEGRDGGSLRIQRGEIFRLSLGDFAIDVTVRFKAIGGDYLTLIECKHLSRRVERKIVQELHDKKQQIHAHKAMVFSTSGFQKGAIRYAKELGIALYDQPQRRPRLHRRRRRA